MVEMALEWETDGKEDLVDESGGLASDYLFQIPTLSLMAL